MNKDELHGEINIAETIWFLMNRDKKKKKQIIPQIKLLNGMPALQTAIMAAGTLFVGTMAVPCIIPGEASVFIARSGSVFLYKSENFCYTGVSLGAGGRF